MTAAASVREQMVAIYISQALYVSLHSSNPGTTGAGEITSAGRQALTWTAGTIDGIAAANPVTFNIVSAVDVTHIGLWTAATGGTFIDSQPCVMSFGAGGTYTMTLTYTQA